MEVLLQPEGSQRGPLLRAMWQMFRSSFLLGTLCIIISDVFRFAVPKLLRWVQALGALLRLVVPSLMGSSRVGGHQLSFFLCLVLRGAQATGEWVKRVLRKGNNTEKATNLRERR